MSNNDLDKIRGEDGKLPAYAGPGGYPILYVDKCGNVLCPDCANREVDPSQEFVGYSIFYEGKPEKCEDCGKEIASAYGDPDAGEEGDDAVQG